MSIQLLQGKTGIIFGPLDESSIAWKVAERCHEHGAKIVITNTEMALRMGTLKNLGEKIGAEIIPADVTSIPDLENLFQKSLEILGGPVDFILHSVGMSPNVRKKKPYSDINYDWFMKTLDISGVSLHKVLQTAMKFDALKEWGSVVTLSFIAAQRVYPDYSDMSQAKAVLESIVRGFGYEYGIKKKVRVNSVSQSPTKTLAGSGVGGFNILYEYGQKMSPLGNADANDCADYCVTLFSDLTKKVTMQNLFHDGGFSNMGLSADVINDIMKGLGELE
jgi:enoyl-[acyl-carrier protein] reductase I